MLKLIKPTTVRSFFLSLILLLCLVTRQDAQTFAQRNNIDQTNGANQNEQEEKIQQFLTKLPSEWRDHAGKFLVSGEILVGVRSDQANQLMAASLNGNNQAQYVDGIEFSALDSQPALTIQRWQVPAGSEWRVIAELQDSPTVEFAEPNWIVQAYEPVHPVSASSIQETIPPPIEIPYAISDTLYKNEQWYLQRINASRALSLVNDPANDLAPKRQVVVGIIDSGIDASHAEFAGRVGEGYDYTNTNIAPPNVDTCTKAAGAQPVTTDGNGHGTHVAGLLGAGLNDGVGVASLGGKVVYIQPLKVLNVEGKGSGYNVARAIDYASKCLGVNIINMSLEIPASDVQANITLNNTIRRAVEDAHKRNVLQIAAAGNEPKQQYMPYPAAYPDVMAIAALTYFNQRASYSNSGLDEQNRDGVDLAAPGGDLNDGKPEILSTWSSQAVAKCPISYPTLQGRTFCFDDGTSMAAPLVSSIAALVWSIRPELSNDEVAQLIKDSASPLPQPPKEVGAGIVDAASALRSVITPKLKLTPSLFSYEVASGAAPFTVGLRMDNPSLAKISWSARIAGSNNWAELNGASNDILSGNTRYGESSFFTMVISPTFLQPGFYYDSVTLFQELPDGSQQTMHIPLSLAIDRQFKRVYLPLIANNKAGPTPSVPPAITTPYQWEQPVTPDDQSYYTMFDDFNLSVSLPPTFTFKMNNTNHSTLRIYSDGFVTFPADEIGTALPNRCLPNWQSPGQAIYGWWANLNPTVVSTFLSDKDHFVIEFEDVPSATSPSYEVSFQIVLYRNGNVGFNYAKLPTFIGATEAATIGIESQDGRFAYLLACNAPNGPPGQRIIGTLPESNQSFLIKAGDIY